ncbi:MAG TPA: CoA transferase [Dehalococcoidia bacterium]|nr:CoA transferase [Dehalococcoidia bacterium]
MLLKGVRVLELSQFLAGPYAGMILGDLGAEVIKIEPPGLRQIADGGLNSDDFVVLATCRNKKSIVLNFKEPEGKEIFYDLVKKADVVLDNYRPGVLERLGFDYENLKSINKQIISCSITGFGSTGPYKDRPAFDLILQAMSGGMSITGNPPPARSGLSISDCVGGMWAAQGVVAALYSREKTGAGNKVEVALLDGQVALLYARVPAFFHMGNVTGGPDIPRPTYRAYKTKDGHLVIAAIGGERFWPGLCRALGREELATDPRFESVSKRGENGDELNSIIEEIMLGKRTEEWIERLVNEGVPAGPVNTIDKVLSDPQVLHQQMVIPVDWVQGDTIWLAGNPIKVSGMEQIFESPPNIGQHTEEVMYQLLGYSDTKIAELQTRQII